MTLGIITGIVIVTLALLICGKKAALKARYIRDRYDNAQAPRMPLTDAEFCARANLPALQVDYVARFRVAFASLGDFDPHKIYPEDDCSDLGINYDDDMAMFLNDQGLLHDHPDYRYSFPLEDVSDFASLILLARKINEKIEQSGAANPCPFGTSVMPPADAGATPEAGRDR